ncbi:TPA: hypothetical protein MYP81_000835 [Citrobacter farmeri]|uniref:hypothetical protein n=1 Tax=Citrobacter TaxID=544 RepID=UPI0004D825BF|nr:MULTISPECIES: hypothetical protein [Citrobacter]MBU5646605.1 hypothetical protein [Pluralibacter sp. S54_ASV_43]HAU5705784.1 hypothetical protein [Citrobacter freundii]KEY45709.1 hypothetical protein DQ02_18705 [Citrobacter amalonaticus]MDZ7528224.1 hypothetical protein [Citrobacter farmeri]QZE48025.1 hypothetical protein Cf24236_3286 [Citrobacter farmeri]
MNKYIAVLIIPFGMLLNNAIASEKMTEIVAKRCAPEPVVFYGQSSDHRKEVLVCKRATGVSYYAGKIDNSAVMNEAIGPRRLKVMFDSGEMKEALLINAGPEVYAISSQGDDNNLFMRMKNNKSKPEVLETEILDKTTVINNLRQHFMK